MSLVIDHDRRQHRFQALVDDLACILDYRLGGNVMTITHTGVPDALSGRGIAGELTKAAMDTARVEGWKVVPACSYADAWLRRHPDYADLQA